MGDGSARLLAGGDETIVAIATAEGRGALAVIRLSGARAVPIAHALGVSAAAARGVRRALLRHPDTGVPLDDAVVTTFTAPRSYTGEDVVEFSTHGGRIAPRLVLEACIAAGARYALPGEFTRRAVLNGRMDLLQAEAVGELIDAPTSAVHAQALSQMDGSLSERFQSLRERILSLEALIAYDIDFPEEDDGPVDRTQVSEKARLLLESLDALLDTVPRAAVLRHGALVVIAGPPNAGKSSLFNALLGEARAIVTPVAGTTRDAIEAVLDTPGIPLRLVDTAGLRDAGDEIERMGIEVSGRYLESAQIVLACGESEADIDAGERVIRERTGAPVLRVLTKTDLHPNPGSPDSPGSKIRLSEHHPSDSLAGQGSSPVINDADRSVSSLGVSARTGEGLGNLLGAITGALSESWGDAPGVEQQVVVLRERQRHGLESARDEVAAFIELWHAGEVPAVIAAVHLQAATAALDSVIGSVSVEDILDKVFSEFCIGK